MELKKYELELNDSSKFLIMSEKTEYCESWCHVFLIEKNKFYLDDFSFNCIYLGDESKDTLIKKFTEADKKRRSNNLFDCRKIDEIDCFSVVTLFVVYSSICVSMPPNNSIIIIYGHPCELLGKVTIQLSRIDFSEWIKILGN